MAHEVLNIKDTLPLPYNIIDAGAFKLNYVGLKSGQSEELVHDYGVMGDFSIELYDEKGIEISEVCDATVGEVYSFYKELEEMMKDIKGSATFFGFDINIVFTAKRTGIIEVEGVYTPYYRGIVTELKFRFETEPTVIDNSLKRFKTLYGSLAELQGGYDFVL